MNADAMAAEGSWLYDPHYPAHWIRRPLHDLAEWVNGLAFRNIHFSAAGMPVIKIAEVKGGISDQTKFTENTYDDAVHVRSGDLLFAWSGQPETSIGAYRWHGDDGWLNQHIFRVTPALGIDDRFLLCLLKYLRPHFVAIAQNKQTTGLGHVTKRDLQRIRGAVPPLAEQEAIAHILSTLDDKIELNRRMDETLEAMTQTLFKSLFVDFDPVRQSKWFQGAACERVASLFPSRLVEGEGGLIPAGWSTGTLRDIAASPRRSTRPAEMAPAAPYIGLEHMPRRSIALTQWDTSATLKSNKWAFQEGEILFGKLRPYFHKVGLAPVDGVCSTDIVVIAPSDPAWSAFVLGLVSSSAFVSYADQGSTGTRMPRTSWALMARYPIAIPPIPVAKAFQGLVQPLLDRIILSIHETRSLVRLRDSLLPRLLSGTIRVRDAERVVEAA